MAILDPIRRGAEELADTLSEGWEWLRKRSARALTRFRARDDEEDLPVSLRGDRWGLLAADVAELDDEVVVRVEAPGLEERDFSVSVVDGQLVVRGEKRFERTARHARYHLFESAYGAFERRFALPCEVDEAGARARYRSGVLTVRLPRSEHDRRKRIPVHPA